MVTTPWLQAEESSLRVSRFATRSFWRKIAIGAICFTMLADLTVRGLFLAFNPAKTDFTEIYTGAWLWRHGQNPYDSALATQAAARLVGTNVTEAIVYPPSTFVVFSPFTYLPWGWANFCCLLLALAGIAAIITLLLRLGNFKTSEKSAFLLLTGTLAFDPIHQAFHVGNIALLVIPLCFFGIYLAENRYDMIAGALLCLAMLVKPQLGLWVMLFYLVQRRLWFLIGSAIPILGFAAVLWRYPLSLHALISGYSQNYQYHFGVGSHLGFTEGAQPFHVNIVQVVLYQLWPSVHGVTVLSFSIFICGLAIWAYSIWKRRFDVPAPLYISSLIAMSFISLYHSVSDASVLVLVLCWALKKDSEQKREWGWSRRLACVIFLLLMLPGHSALMRMMPHLPSTIVTALWWKLFIARYFVWVLMAMNVVLLWAVTTAPQSRATPQHSN